MFMKKNNTVPQRILFLYYDPHPFHAKMAKSVGAIFYAAPKLKSESSNMFTGGISIINAVIKLPKNFDIYFCEGTYIIPAIAKKLRLINKNAKIVNILASPLLYYIKTGLIKGLRKEFAVYLLKNVDLFVSIGDMEDNLLKESVPCAKSIISYPNIEEKKFKKVGKIITKSALQSKKILVVGTHSAYYKGVDLALEAFKIVRKEHPDATLDVVGKMSDIGMYINKNSEGIMYKGHVDNLLNYMRNYALCVHMGRGDTFPVSTMEAMSIGLPTIISHFTGTKKIVSNVDKNMIVPLDSGILAEKISRYFNLSEARKRNISNKFRKAESEFNKKDYVLEFHKNFYKALKL